MSAPYRYRIVECPDCFEGRYEVASGIGYVSHECETCDGTGELDAQCAECLVVTALNDDGLCERCEDAITLPVAEFDAKYGLTRVRSDPLRSAAA